MRSGPVWTPDPIVASMLVLFGLAAGLTLSGAFAAHLVPHAVHAGWLSLPYGPLVAAAFGAFGVAVMYAASFIGQMAGNAGAGRGGGWQFDPAFDRAAGYAARGIGSFLCGPIVLAGAGLVYWLRCGQMTVLDWTILAELALLTAVAWLLLWLGTTVSGRFAVSPERIRSLLRRCGVRGVCLVLGAGSIIVLSGASAVLAIREIQLGHFTGMLWLGGCAFSGIGVTTWVLSHLSRAAACKGGAGAAGSL